MEKLINSIPKEINATGIDKNGIRLGSGFCLRWSANRQKWLCGYTLSFKRGREDNQNHPWAEADDPVEAVALFVELVSSRSTNV